MRMEELHRELDEVLQIKVEDFKTLGYENVKKEDMWDYLVTKIWQGKVEELHLYQLVADVLALSPQDYMNSLSLNVNPSSPEFFFQRFEE